ncbi:MAG: hypothetical protein ABIV51_04220 [Saprospiraceae bacterium]
MRQTLTQEEVVAFIYGELEDHEFQLMMSELLYDVDLQEEVADLKQAKNELPKVTFSPKLTTLTSILSYSR